MTLPVADTRFFRPAPGKPTTHLFIGNCGPSVGVELSDIEAFCAEYGDVIVSQPDASRAFAFASFATSDQASTALEALASTRALGGRTLTVKFAGRHPKFEVRELPAQCSASRRHSLCKAQHCSPHLIEKLETLDVPVSSSISSNERPFCGPRLSWPAVQEEAAKQAQEDVSFTRASDLAIPGLCLYLDFVTEQEEADLIEGVADSDWQLLAKRQVCHFGYEFQYAVRRYRPSHPLCKGRLWPQLSAAHQTTTMQRPHQAWARQRSCPIP